MAPVKLSKAEICTGISPLCSMVNELCRCQGIFVFSGFRMVGGVSCWVDGALPPYPHRPLDESAFAMTAEHSVPSSTCWYGLSYWALPRRCSILGASTSVARWKRIPWIKRGKLWSRDLRITEAAQGDRVRGREMNDQVEASRGFCLHVYGEKNLWGLLPFYCPVSHLPTVFEITDGY